MASEGIHHIAFLQKEKEQIAIVQTNNAPFGKKIVVLLQNVIIMKKGITKMDELYKSLINFSVGVPISRKRLLRIHGITSELIQRALDNGSIVETTPLDIGEIRYLIKKRTKEIII